MLIYRLYCIDQFAYKIVRNRRETLAALKAEKQKNGESESENENEDLNTGYRDLLSLYIDKGF